MIDHDALFKTIISEFFLEFMELFLPDIASDIEPNSIQEKEQELFTDIVGGKTHRVDLIRQVKLKDEPNLVLILVEAQSYDEKEFGNRLFRYFTRLHDKYGLDLLPVAVFSYNSPKELAPSIYKLNFRKRNTVTFNYVTIQLNRLDWQDFVDKANPVACAFLSKMQMDKTERAEVKLTALSKLTELGLNPAQSRLISGFVDTYLPLNATEQAEFEQKLTEIEQDKKEEVMELVTSWMIEGMAKGIKEGEKRVLLKQLNHRFGELSTQEEVGIDSLSEEQLVQLAQDSLDFKSREELVGWLNRANG
jgi:hypothetical protein